MVAVCTEEFFDVVDFNLNKSALSVGHLLEKAHVLLFVMNGVCRESGVHEVSNKVSASFSFQLVVRLVNVVLS